MFAPLIFAAAVVAAASPAPAWEPLACQYCTAAAPRAAQWSFEAAAAAPDTQSAWRDYILPDAVRGHRYTTQAQCLAALRAALPVVTDNVDDAGQITTRRHRRDHIAEWETIPGVQTGSALFGCFHHAERVS